MLKSFACRRHRFSKLNDARVERHIVTEDRDQLRRAGPNKLTTKGSWFRAVTISSD